MNSAHSPIASRSTSSTWKDRKRHTATAAQLTDWASQYRQHFEWLNQRYFNNQLPAYRVSLQDPLIVPGVPGELCCQVFFACPLLFLRPRVAPPAPPVRG